MPEPERRGSVLGGVLRLSLLVLAIVGAYTVAEDVMYRLAARQAEPRLVEPRGDLAEFEQATIAVFESAAPSVAYIFSFGGLPFHGVARGAGSGFVWDDLGHVVTNHHVVANAERVAVRLDLGEPVPAEVIGSAPDYDLAVLRLRRLPRVLQPLPLGAAEELRVGQAVYAIGNPFGLSRSLTTGIVSALDRRLPTQTGREIRGMIQTDATINPGNSGGPLLDSAGRLIGVTTAIISETGTSAGIGFAVPVDVVNRIVPQLIAEGRIARPGIGIAAAPEEFSAQIGVDGVVVVQVMPGGPAAEAGMIGLRGPGEIGDVIVAVNGTPVRTIAQLAAELERAGIGSTVRLTVARDGRQRTVALPVADIGG